MPKVKTLSLTRNSQWKIMQEGFKKKEQCECEVAGIRLGEAKPCKYCKPEAEKGPCNNEERPLFEYMRSPANREALNRSGLDVLNTILTEWYALNASKPCPNSPNGARTCDNACLMATEAWNNRAE